MSRLLKKLSDMTSDPKNRDRVEDALLAVELTLDHLSRPAGYVNTLRNRLWEAYPRRDYWWQRGQTQEDQT